MFGGSYVFWRIHSCISYYTMCTLHMVIERWDICLSSFFVFLYLLLFRAYISVILCLYIHSPVFAVSYLLGQYQCFARNKYGTAITNSVFVRKSELFNFKDEPPQTMDVEEGLPFGISCAAPNGWPKPNVQWMITAEKSLKTINSSR